MEVNKKQLADIFGASIRTIQNWQEQGMPVLRGGGKGNEVLYDSAAVIKWYAERDSEIENEKLRREVRVSVPFRTGRNRECPFCEAVARVMRCFMTLPPS
ncbi:terminase small subunit [Escherichia coli]|uniref:terminase small subunit n=1 Tax=Escherichia coli TaxID=562 RepID=UPI0009667ED7|nr:terminase small subunit [Escherichia coli]OKP64422.1 hypothetical protein A8A03_19315 [Escherichia coli]